MMKSARAYHSGFLPGNIFFSQIVVVGIFRARSIAMVAQAPAKTRTIIKADSIAFLAPFPGLTSTVDISVGSSATIQSRRTSAIGTLGRILLWRPSPLLSHSFWLRALDLLENLSRKATARRLG